VNRSVQRSEQVKKKKALGQFELRALSWSPKKNNQNINIMNEQQLPGKSDNGALTNGGINFGGCRLAGTVAQQRSMFGLNLVVRLCSVPFPAGVELTVQINGPP